MNSAIPSNVPRRGPHLQLNQRRAGNQFARDRDSWFWITEGEQELAFEKAVCWAINHQDVGCSPNVSQYTNDGIEPTHPSSRVKSIESVPVGLKETVGQDG